MSDSSDPPPDLSTNNSQAPLLEYRSAHVAADAVEKRVLSGGQAATWVASIGLVALAVTIAAAWASSEWTFYIGFVAILAFPIAALLAIIGRVEDVSVRRYENVGCGMTLLLGLVWAGILVFVYIGASRWQD